MQYNETQDNIVSSPFSLWLYINVYEDAFFDIVNAIIPSLDCVKIEKYFTIFSEMCNV